MPQPSCLRGLGPEFYRGLRSIHWSMIMDQSHASWLDWTFHAHLREALLHVLSRFRLACPAYTCLPDDIHLLLTGLSERSDQRPALRMLRTELNRLLRQNGLKLQEPTHEDLRRVTPADWHSIESAGHAMLNIPVRRGLSETPQAWPFQGAAFPGYPSMDPNQPDHWERFWKAFKKATDAYASENRGSSATRG